MPDVFSGDTSPVDYTQFLPKEAPPPAAPPGNPKEAAKAGDDYLAKELELSKTMRSSEETEMARLAAYQDRIEKLASRHTAVPKDPNLVKPEEPPKQNFTDPIKAFQNPAVIIATMGSLFTRAPLTAAMNAGGAAMEAYHKGEAEQFAIKRDEWKENLDRAIQLNKIELEKYDAAWKRSDAAVKDKMAEMQAIASGMKNEAVLAAIRNADPDRVMGIYENLRKGQEKLEEAREKQASMERIAAERSRALGAKQDQKTQQRQEQVNSIVNQIDRVQQIIKQNPDKTTVGIGGMANRAEEWLTGGSDLGEMEQLLRTIQIQIKPALTGSNRMTATERKQLDTIVPGLGVMRSTEQVYNELEKMKKILQKKDLIVPEVEADPLAGVSQDEIAAELARRGEQ